MAFQAMNHGLEARAISSRLLTNFGRKTLPLGANDEHNHEVTLLEVKGPEA